MTSLFTDPHLGGKRSANTTPASRARMQENVFNSVESIVSSGGPEEELFCLGDLFDSYSNSEMVIARALPLLQKMSFCMAGNHDLVHDNIKTGTLELLMDLKETENTQFAYCQFDSREVFERVVGNTVYYAVPHISDQERFELTLADALDEAKNSRARMKDYQPHYLLLHCNYDNPFTDETSLNLTRENAEELLEVFDYLVLGHEHNHRTDFGGRLVVLGNTYPTNFGDIGDKHFMIVDDTTGEYILQTHWRKEVHYWEVDWRNAGAVSTDLLDRITHVKITGEVAPSDVKQYSHTMKSLWSNLPNICCIKSEVQFEGINATDMDTQGSLDRLPQIISKQLEGTEYEALWKELSNAVES